MEKIKGTFALMVFIGAFFSHSTGFALSTRDLIEKFDKISSYSTLLKSAGENGDTVIHYFYKKPGLIKMVFVKPHNGAELVYNPESHGVQLRPFTSLGTFTLHLKPESFLIRDPKGHTVDRSDLGALLRNVLILAENGTEEIRDTALCQKAPCAVLAVTGAAGFTLEGVSQYLLWVDTRIHLPVRVESYDHRFHLVEKVILEDLMVDVELAEDFFQY